MSEQEIIAEIEEIAVEVTGTDLVPVPQGNLFGTDDPGVIIEKATVLADKLSQVLKDRGLTSRIGARDHVRVEGWTLLGTMLGVFSVVEWTRKLEDGYEARAVAKTLAGQVVGAAEAVCLRSENQWKSRDEYALKSMAQTRAVSKALRGPLGFVVTLAGFEATPAEEMPQNASGGFGGPYGEERRVEGPKPLAAPKTWPAVTQMVSAFDKDTHDTFFAFVRAATKLTFGTESIKSLANKADRDYMLQKAAGAALHLREEFDPNVMPPPGVDDIRACFARVLDGQELALEGEES